MLISLIRNLCQGSILTLFCLTLNQTTIAAPINLTKLEIPQRAPSFSLMDLDKNIHKLEDYKGKPLIINFWASWCRPCRAELPAFNRAWAKVKDQGIQMLAINIGEEPATVYRFIQDFPIDFRILLDPKSDELNNWQMHGLPTTFILNTKGEVVYQAIGEREWDNNELLTKVLELRKPL